MTSLLNPTATSARSQALRAGRHAAAALTGLSLAMSAALSVAQPSSSAATIAKPLGTTSAAGAIAASQLVKLEVKSVTLQGDDSAPRGVIVCVANSGAGIANNVRIGSGFTYREVLNGVERTVNHHNGSGSPVSIASQQTVCSPLLGFADWQREMFRKCQVLEVHGGVGDSDRLSRISMSIKPRCARLIDLSPRLPASMPIRPRDLTIPTGPGIPPVPPPPTSPR